MEDDLAALDRMWQEALEVAERFPNARSQDYLMGVALNLDRTRNWLMAYDRRVATYRWWRHPLRLWAHKHGRLAADGVSIIW